MAPPAEEARRPFVDGYGRGSAHLHARAAVERVAAALFGLKGQAVLHGLLFFWALVGRAVFLLACAVAGRVDGVDVFVRMRPPISNEGIPRVASRAGAAPNMLPKSS